MTSSCWRARVTRTTRSSAPRSGTSTTARRCARRIPRPAARAAHLALLELHGLEAEVIGRHGGRSRVGKARSLGSRMRALHDWARGRTFDVALRPRTLAELVGQDKIKEQLGLLIEGARKRLKELRKEGEFKTFKHDVLQTKAEAAESAAVRSERSSRIQVLAKELGELSKVPVREFFKY